MKKILRSTIVLLVLVGVSSSTWADDVTDWNQMLFRVGLVAGTNATNMGRVAAIVQASVFDAVNGIDHRYTPIHVTSSAPGGASRRAAAIQAAYAALIKFYGTGGVFVPPAANQQAALDARRRVALTEVATDESAASIDAGIAWGQTVADAIYTWRSTDDNTAPPTFTGGTGLGQWRPTLNLPAAGTSTPGAGFPQFSNQTPWTMLSPSQFRPPAPYAPTVAAALASARYAADFNETKNMGSFGSANRTADQTVYSLVWAAGTASYLWNNAALSMIDGRNRDRDEKEKEGKKNKHHSTLLENARLLASLDIAIADAAIGCWDAKYAYSFWRPITAIRETADDGNPLTTPDPNWMPMFATPAHPDYPSGHSCVSGAAAVILGNEFGDHVKFSISSDLVPGVSRQFHGVADALEEVKNARIFAGIHFRLACEVGQALGKAVAGYVLANQFQRVN
jgi:hypothetical protein